MSDKHDVNPADRFANVGRRAVLGAGAGIGAVAAAELLGKRAFGKAAGAPVVADDGPDKGVLRAGRARLPTEGQSWTVEPRSSCSSSPGQ